VDRGGSGRVHADCRIAASVFMAANAIGSPARDRDFATPQRSVMLRRHAIESGRGNAEWGVSPIL